MTHPYPWLILATALLLGGCTWVKPDPGAEQVRLVPASEAQDCQRIGRATASVRDRVAGVQRRAERVGDELADLARNSAIELGGDTIVADSPVTDGEQRFIIYRCRD